MHSFAVLGATGNIGRAILQILLDRGGDTIHAYCRSQEKLFHLFPNAETSRGLTIFQGELRDEALMDECLRKTDAVFLAVAIVDNMPGCTVAMQTAEAVVASLKRLRATPGSHCPRLVMVSSASLEPSFCGDVPAPVHWVLKTAVSHLYRDLAAAEAFLRSQSGWLSTTFVKPGGLVHDQRRGHEVRLDRAHTPLSFLDLAAGMVEIAEADDNRYHMENVSVVPTSKQVRFPWDGVYYAFTGLLFHFFPWTYRYLGEYPSAAKKTS
ncbi:Averufin oxidase A [Aspergillus venezuelensis]